jgi:hypothetical protein
VARFGDGLNDGGQLIAGLEAANGDADADVFGQRLSDSNRRPAHCEDAARALVSF